MAKPGANFYTITESLTVRIALNMTVFAFFNAFVTRFSCVCMKRVLKRVDSRFSRYKRVSQQPIKSALQKREKNAFGPDFAQKISTNQKHLYAFANDVENAKIANPS